MCSQILLFENNLTNITWQYSAWRATNCWPQKVSKIYVYIILICRPKIQFQVQYKQDTEMNLVYEQAACTWTNFQWPVAWRAAIIRGFNVDNAIDFFRKLCFSRSLADDRFSGSTSRQQWIKSRNSGDSFSSFLTSGFPFVAILYMALSGVSFRYGGSPSNISMIIMPSDQISTLFPYCFLDGK